MNKEKWLKRQREMLAMIKAEGRSFTAAEQKEFDELSEKIQSAVRAEGNSSKDDEEEDDDEADEEDDEEEDDKKDSKDPSRALEIERRRVSGIVELCEKFADMNLNIRKLLSDEKMSIGKVRKMIIDKQIENGAPSRAAITADEGDKFRNAASDALMMRSGRNIEDKNRIEAARQYRGLSLRDLAKDCLEREGVNTRGMSPTEVFDEVSKRSFFNPTAAFPAILDNAINKNIVDIYEHTPTTFDLWTTKGTLSDFKENKDHEYVLGGLSDFELVPENGEIKADAPATELLPKRKLDTYAKQFTMTRQAFINDDIGFLSTIPGTYARKAKDTIDSQVYSILMDDPKIFDNKKLFEASHNNTAKTAAKPSIDSLKEMYLLMGGQKDQFGDAITLQPKFILVGNQNQFDVYTTLHSAQVTGSANNDVNPFYESPLQTIVVNKLDQKAGTGACPWFMIADQLTARSIQVDYLDGNETPTIRRMETPGTLGFVWDIYFDWGVAVRDYRGIYKNKGLK